MTGKRPRTEGQYRESPENVRILLMTMDPALHNLSLKTLFCFLSMIVFSAIQMNVGKRRDKTGQVGTGRDGTGRDGT